MGTRTFLITGPTAQDLAGPIYSEGSPQNVIAAARRRSPDLEVIRVETREDLRHAIEEVRAFRFGVFDLHGSNGSFYLPDGSRSSPTFLGLEAVGFHTIVICSCSQDRETWANALPSSARAFVFTKSLDESEFVPLVERSGEAPQIARSAEEFSSWVRDVAGKSRRSSYWSMVQGRRPPVAT